MNNIKLIELAQYEKPQIIESKKEEWVEYGSDNNYFQWLIDRYTNSTTNNAVINNISRLIYGRGLSALDNSSKPNEYAQLLSLIDKESIRKNALEIKLFSQTALQVIYEKGKKSIKKALHIPVNNLRAEKCNKDGEIEAYYYSDNWQDTKNYKPQRIPAFGYGGSELIEILYIQPYSVGLKYYSYVDYVGSLPYSVLEEEISEYLINEVQNSFSPTFVINFNNGVPDDEKIDEISSKVERKLTGSGGKKIITSFNNNKESQTEVTPVPLNDAPAHYSYLSEECQRKIMVGHNVTSPLLFGLGSANGFSSNADELKNAYILFDNLVIRTFQDLLCEAYDKVLAYNGISLKLYFVPLKPTEFNDLNPPKEQQQVNMNEHIDLSGYGEEIDENWLLIDERDVDYDLEDSLNEHLDTIESELFSTKLSLKERILNFVSTGTARPTAVSSQDKQVKGTMFKVRYKYTGNPNPEREFCKAMMSANKVYRKEDIDRMSESGVNRGFGEFGADNYDIFRFKGGARCHHKWVRLTYMLNDKEVFEQIGTAKASVKGFKVTNPFEVSIYPNNLPLKGFSPNNKNLPSDVK